jgi:predicted aspartyl protease
MPISAITFGNSKALDPARNYRAYADVLITDVIGVVRSPTYPCLVDTGADYTILPVSAAVAVGIIPAGPWVTFRTAGGATYALWSHLGVRLVVEGYAITTQVAFSTAPGFSPVLGRLELVAAFDTGFDTSNWYWD